MRDRFGTALKWSARAIGLVAGTYAAYVSLVWLRYGDPARRANSDEEDALLDQVLPEYEVTERHHIQVAAPAEIMFRAACEVSLMESPLIRAIFRVREVILGSQPPAVEHPHGLVAWTQSIGWGVLAEVPGHELVMGAVTQPWQADVVFHPLAPDQFVAFHEPDYVKIAWTLRVERVTGDQSVFRTETRVVTTDAVARAKFRRYWAFFSPGIWFIRWFLLRQLRTAAESCGVHGRGHPRPASPYPPVR